tara:strand:- start:200 stop:787 length:588 start_codon:yes stop_codon:yes gene_type:complete
MAKLNEMIREFRESINQSVEALAMLLQLSPEEYNQLEENWNPPDPVLERICTLFEWNYQDIKRISLQGPFNKESDSEEEGDADTGQSSPASLPFSQRLAQARMEAGKRPKAWRCCWGFQKITISFWKKTPNQMMIFCVVFVDFSIGITMKSCKNCEPEITHFIVQRARHYLLMRCGWMKSREVSQNFRKFKHRSH